MAALTLPPLPNAIIRPIETEAWTAAEPQGAEDKLLRQRAEAVLKHYHHRAEYLLAQGTAYDYMSVPFESVRKIRVTCKRVGELKPIPYPMDE
jgi:hypothetical protein